MPKILVIEDEIFERAELKKQLSNWYGPNNVFIASCVDEAIEVVNSTKPVVILLDIRLKGKSGFEVARYVRKYYPKIQIIIITAYNEFDYARTALSLNISNYLSKPVRPNILFDTINNALEKYNNLNESFESVILWHFLESGNQQLFLNSIDFIVNSVFVIGFEKSKDYNSMYYEYIRSHLSQYNLQIEKKEKKLIAYCNEEIDKLMGTFFKITKNFSKEFHHSIVFGVSEVNGDIVKAYNEALLSCNHKIFYPLKTVLVYKDVKKNWGKDYEYPLMLEQKLIRVIRESNKAYIEEMFDDLIKGYIISSKNNYVVLETWIDNLINSLKKICIEENILVNYLPQLDNKPFWFSTSHFKKDLYKIINEIRINIIKTISTNHPIINKAISIIKQDYKKRITLTSLCKTLSINSSYFSRLFKQETGMSFKNYLIDIRMKRAKELLLNEEIQVFQVALEIGYSDPNYFSEAFKKYEGISPTQYRGNNKIIL